MVYHERAAWAGLVGAFVTAAVYIWMLQGQTDDWIAPMLWAIGAGIVFSIVVTIVWGMAVGVRDREAATASDLRDRDISRFGGRAESVVLVIAGLAVIALCAIDADVFWIATTMFAGFVVGAIAGGLARVVAYRRGLA